MAGFADKNSINPWFVALADHCLQKGSLTMIQPTIALSAPSGRQERRVLAQRYHIDTIVTSHQPGNVNMSQDTGINESIVIIRAHEGMKPSTRIVNLDRLPMDESEVGELHRVLLNCRVGQLADGWGEVSYWPPGRIADGDWTACLWRSPELQRLLPSLPAT